MRTFKPLSELPPVERYRTPAEKRKRPGSTPPKEKTKAKEAERAEIQVKAPEVQFPWRPYQKRFISDPSRRVLWVKSAQIGGSTAIAGRSLGRCIEREKHLVVLLSASEPQAKELALKAKRFCSEFAGMESEISQGFFKKTEMQEHTIKLPNGSRMIAIAGNPDTARGYTGDIVLDEFAHHQKPAEIFTAAYRQVTLGDYAMLIASTPNGQGGHFWQQAHGLGLDLGTAPAAQPTRAGTWTGHWTDIYMAVQEGLRVNIEEIREGCDALTWSQEYCCVFLSESEMWLPPSLIDAAASPDANIGPPALYRSNLYAGWDVARNRNLSVIWFNELLGDVSVCRGLVELQGMSTPDQLTQARTWMPQVIRMNIDKTGMGLVIAETLEQEFPQKASGVLFTAPTKEAMAIHSKLRLEQRKMRLPNDTAVRRAFLSLRRSVNKIGQARFDAENDEKYGHADQFWASALAEMAAELQINQALRNVGFGSQIMFDAQQNRNSPFSNFTTRVL